MERRNSYCNNNPVNYDDQAGQSPATVIRCIISATSSVVCDLIAQKSVGEIFLNATVAVVGTIFAPLGALVTICNAVDTTVSVTQTTGDIFFDRIPSVRANHVCHALSRRDNLFRGKLFCDCCGHPLTISRKQLKHRDADIYFCMYHYHHPDICPKTHRVYHEMLYPYVLQQIRNFAKSMKRRKVNSAIKDYADVKELTPEILDAVIERIEVSHVSRKSRPGNVIQIYWKLR